MPSPDLIMETLGGYLRSSCLKGAIELDLFTAIDEGAKSVSAIAAHCRASERGVRILSDCLAVMGFVVKSGEEYSLTPDSAAFLSRRSPMYIGSIAHFLNSDYVMDRFRDMAELVRQGTALNHGEGLEPEHPMWVEFARSMGPTMTLPAKLIAEIVLRADQSPMKILDIAAGHGIYGITFAARNPNVKITAVDWAIVLQVAKENAERLGVSDRYETIPGSAFDVDFGSGYDVVLIPNFLHHFEPGVNEQFLRKVKAALAPDGRVAVVEFVPNPDRVSPPFPAMFSMMMLGSTPRGDAYTFAELESMLTKAGFQPPTRYDLLPTASTLLVSGCA